MFWALALNAIKVGIPRLFLFPLTAYTVDKESFGMFATAFRVLLYARYYQFLYIKTYYCHHVIQ